MLPTIWSYHEIFAHERDPALGIGSMTLLPSGVLSSDSPDLTRLTKLYLDDARDPPNNNWVVMRDYNAAVKFIVEEGCPDYISFDHDLGLGPSGYDFAKWFVNYDIDYDIIPEYFDFAVHSANPVGAANIRGLMKGYLKQKYEE